jgi:hypothetical protein
MIRFLRLLLVLTFRHETRDDFLSLSTAHLVAAKECIGHMQKEPSDIPSMSFVCGVYSGCVDRTFASTLGWNYF